jgi:hypothetical membrane protein
MTGTFTGRTAPSSRSGRHQARSGSQAAIVFGGVIWILATLQYGLAQIVVASAWHHPPYSWLTNYISDLGNAACGRFAVPRGTPAYVCSPLHATMNASFIVTGVLTMAGAVLLHRMWPHRRRTSTALVLWIIAGLGKIAVGLVPENTNFDLHLLAAFNIPVGCVAILLLSLSIRGRSPSVAAAGIALATVGLVGTVLSTAGQFGGSFLYLGLGAGGMERIADYPGSIWVLLIGVLAVFSARVPASQGDSYASA